MGLFGGGNSKTSSNTTNTEQTVANYGAGPATTLNLSGITTGASSNFNIATSDYGAIEAGTSLARDALKSSLASVGSIASDVVGKTLSIAAKNQVSEGAQMQDTLIKVALVIGAVIAVVAIFRGSK
ncbi:MAG: hypothetical protein Q8Q73_14780 [Stagnimonas sp.]|nr:hypothetical protein [Stagnimonas sp.]